MAVDKHTLVLTQANQWIPICNLDTVTPIKAWHPDTRNAYPVVHKNIVKWYTTLYSFTAPRSGFIASDYFKPLLYADQEVIKRVKNYKALRYTNGTKFLFETDTQSLYDHLRNTVDQIKLTEYWKDGAFAARVLSAESVVEGEAYWLNTRNHYIIMKRYGLSFIGKFV